MREELLNFIEYKIGFQFIVYYAIFFKTQTSKQETNLGILVSDMASFLLKKIPLPIVLNMQHVWCTSSKLLCYSL